MYKQFFCSSFVTTVTLLLKQVKLLIYVNLILNIQVSNETMTDDYYY